MNTKLSYISDLGRFEDKISKKQYNIKKGRNIQRGIDILFYLYRGKRIVISDKDFFDNFEKIPNIMDVAMLSINSNKEEQSFQQKMISWLEDRITITKEEIENSDKDMKIKKGCKLRGLKECLAYAQTH